MINATSGISCTQNIKFTSGISAISGIKGTLPESYQAFYPFNSNFIDQVSNDYIALFDNIPSFGGGGVNTVANTNLRVTAFQQDGKGVYLDENGNGGVPFITSNFTGAGWTNGASPTGLLLTAAQGQPGKFAGLVTSDFIGAPLYAGNSIAIITATPSNEQITFIVVQGTWEDFQRPNLITIDFSFSGYYPNETGVGSVAEVRDDAGDDVSGFPAAVQWDTSGDFRFGYIGIGKTVADITSQVLLQLGNMGISTGIGITFAEIGASISSLPVTSDTIAGECFIKYVGGMLSIVIDGVESTPVASAAPVIGAFAQEGANTSNMLAAPGTYGGLLFEVL